MIALFFEVKPHVGLEDRYLEIAASLKPALEASGGVVYLDRFRSLARDRVMLSHQIWQDEASLARWRANGRHYGAQSAGRTDVFEDYRLQVGAVVAELGQDDRRLIEVPDGQPYNDPGRQPERYLVVARHDQPPPRDGAGESWQSVYDQIRFARVVPVASRDAGLELLDTMSTESGVVATQLCLISRDYGMFDRGEAPQYFPASKAR